MTSSGTGERLGKIDDRAANRLRQSRDKVVALAPSDVNQLALVRSTWDSLVERSPSLYRLYQSAAWWDHLHTCYPDVPMRLVIVKDESGEIQAIQPCYVTNQGPGQSIGRRQFYLFRADCVELLGSEPLGQTETAETHASLITAMWKAFPSISVARCKSALADRPFTQSLQGFQRRREGFFAVQEAEFRQLYAIDLNEGVATYFKTRFNAKKRNDLSRKVRIMERLSAGGIRLERITTSCSVAQHFGSLCDVLRSDRLTNVRETPSELALCDAADRGFLASYLLYLGDVPVSYVLGYLQHGVYHYSDVAYCNKLSAHSPGSVLLYLILRDLEDCSQVQWFNFGIGNAEYKRRFSNCSFTDATYFIMKKTVTNTWRAALLRARNGLRTKLQARLRPRATEP